MGQIYILTDIWHLLKRSPLLPPCEGQGKQKHLFCLYQSSHVQIDLVVQLLSVFSFVCHMDCSMPDCPVLHYLQEFAQIHGFPGGSDDKRLPAMWETRVQFLGREDPLAKEMAIHSSTLAWKILWTEEPGKLQSMGLQRVGHDWATSLSLSNYL